jgi:HD-GYP domain-containing protein (c-di-GMP phosphodiesterase class II)
VSELLPTVPAPLDELIARMLHRVPSQRPTAEQVARELETWIEVELKLEAIPPIQPQSVSSYAVLQVMQASLARRLAPHSGRPQRMAKYAEALAKHLAKYPGWETLADEKRIEELGHLAAIHDLGWLAVPQSSSARPTAATTEKLHTMLAEGLLGELTAGHQASLPFLRLARQIVRSHHERWDGQGFPDGLRGEAIPRMARIVALADAYDTLRTGHDHATATAELRGEAGTRFDPVVIEAFRRWSREWDAIYLSVPDPIDK